MVDAKIRTFGGIKMKRIRSKQTVFFVISCIVLTLYSLILFSLFVWAIIASLKSNSEFRLNYYKLPKKIVNNYWDVLKNFTVNAKNPNGKTLPIGIGTMTLNSVLYAVGCAFINTLVCCVTSYFCARYNYKLSKIMYATVVVVMILPVVGSMPSEIQMAKRLGIYGTMYGMWIMKANFLGLYFLVFYEYFSSLPNAFFESAQIDGAGDVSLLTRIGLPLSVNLFFTVLLINFVVYWNDYQTPLIYLKGNPVLAYGMYIMAQENDSSLTWSHIPSKMAGAVMILVPVIILFACTSKRLMGNLTIGGVKG